MKTRCTVWGLIVVALSALSVWCRAAADDQNYDAAVNLIKAQQYGAARTLLDKALEDAPTSIKVLYAAAYAADKDGDPEVARNLYRKLLHVYYATPEPTQEQRGTVERAKKALGQVSPASLYLLGAAEEIKGRAERTDDKAERALLMVAAADLRKLAIGEVKLDLPDRTVEMSHDEPENTGSDRMADTEKALGYKLSGLKRIRNHADARRWGGNGHWYKVFPGKVTYQEAAKQCRELGGYLATATSPEETEFLVELGGRKVLWIGLSDEKREGQWNWITGEPFAWTNWRSTPSGGRDQNYSCFTITWVAPHGIGMWNDVPGDFAKIEGFICEWEK